LSRHLRVLFLSWRDQHHPEAGGAEKYLVEVAEGLARRGHQVTVRTAAYPGAIRDEVVHGVAYSRRGGRFGVFPRALASRLVGRLRADVVVDIQNGVPFLSPLAGGRVINLVHHVHREQWPVVVGKKAAGIGWWLESEVAPRVYRRVPYVVVSPSTGRELAGLGVDADRMSVIYNGTDVVKDEHIERSATPQIIVLGRLVPHKRVELAIDALALLAPAHPDLSMLVVGSGWWGHRLEEYAESAGVRDRITFTDHVSEAEKHRLLAQAWVQALPSLKEGWGLVVVEAGVHGTPTVGFYEAGGVQDSIRDGETGLLCEEGAPALAVALGRIIDDAELREKLSRQVQEWVAQFRWDQTVDVWERLLIGADEGAAAEDVDGSSPEPEFGHNKTHGP
jgi:glycosyltransferase involved in cell wall biosynthesis